MYVDGQRVPTTERVSLRMMAEALSGLDDRHWERWSWRRARGPLRKANGVSLEAIVNVVMEG